MRDALRGAYWRARAAQDRLRLRALQWWHPGLEVAPDATPAFAGARYNLAPGARLRIGAGAATERRPGALSFVIHAGGEVVIEDGAWLRTEIEPISIDICVGDSLRVALLSCNSGDKSVTISQALHTYFHVGDIGKVRVLGLDGTEYLDKVHDSTLKMQSGPVTVDGEVDRIYTGVSGDLVIDDESLARKIRIRSRGCSTAVVWNPWIETAASMGDLDDDDYRKMICVETANAGPETIEIAAGGTCRLEAEYTIEG